MCPLCVRYVFVTCPLFMRGVCVQVPSTDWVTHAPRTPTAYKRTMTGYIQDKTDMHRTANEYSYPLLSVSSFVHAQNFPTDTTGRTVHHLTWNEWTEHKTDIKRILTNITGYPKMLSVSRPVAQSGKVWRSHSLKYIIVMFLTMAFHQVWEACRIWLVSFAWQDMCQFCWSVLYVWNSPNCAC